VQALMPGVVKQAYPTRIGVMTGLYSAAIMGGGGLGAMASPWVAHAFGGAQADWHAGLAIWALLAAVALLYVAGHAACSAGDTKVVRRAAPEPLVAALLRQPRAWLLAVCFGLINGGYTSLVAWLPHFYAQQGWSAQQGGSVLALMTAWRRWWPRWPCPPGAQLGRDMRPWLALTLLAQLAGFAR
jgi:CP family cyanate transporter-like MFS transporter